MSRFLKDKSSFKYKFEIIIVVLILWYTLFVDHLYYMFCVIWVRRSYCILTKNNKSNYIKNNLLTSESDFLIKTQLCSIYKLIEY